jgi:hypothetical protein
MNFARTLCLAAGVMLGLFAGLPDLAAQDALSIGTSTMSRGGIVTVPIHLVDVEGTPLGEEYVYGQNIQGIAFQIQYEPAAAVASISLERAGATFGLTPYETTRKSGNTFSYLMSCNEGWQKLHDLTGAGSDIANLIIQIASDAAPNSTVALKFLPARTMLSNSAGTILETTASGGLTLTDGSVAISGAPVAISVAISAKGKAAEKGRKAAKITITRTGSTKAALAVALRLKGKAKNGVDYERLPAAVTIPAKKARATFMLKPIDDKIKEKAETAIIAIKPSRRYDIAPPGAVTVTISDNDSKRR